MITTLDIGDILYKDCKALMGTFGINPTALYHHPNEPVGEVTTERVIIHSPNSDTPEKIWDKSFANINLVVPDKNGKKDITRLQTLQRLAKANLDDRYGVFDKTKYIYEIASIGTEQDTDLKCNYVNVKILFSILNTKLL